MYVLKGRFLASLEMTRVQAQRVNYLERTATRSWRAQDAFGNRNRGRSSPGDRPAKCGRPGAYLADLRINKTEDKTVVIAVVRAPWAYSPNQTAAMQESLPRTRPPIELHIRSIIPREATPKGWINRPPPQAQTQFSPGP